MIKCFSVLALALPVVACAHLARTPAQAVASTTSVPTNCAEGFQMTFDPIQLEQSYQIDQYIYHQMREYLERGFEPWVKEYMERSRRDLDCETEREADQYAADIKSKTARFTARVRQESDPSTAQAILANPVFNNPKTAAQLACYGECATRKMQANAPSAVTCQKKCGTSDLLTHFYEDSLTFKGIAGLCFNGVTPASSQAKQKEFTDEYQKTLPPYLTKLAAVQEGFHRELETDRRIVAELGRIKSEFEKFKAARAKSKCGPAKYAWEASVRAATVDLATPEDSGAAGKTRSVEGSGFYTFGNSGRYLVTAAHVSDPDINAKSVARSMMTVIRPGRKEPPGEIEFAIRPGLVDLGRDITLAKENKPGPALPLANAADIPVPGQRFYVTGYPAGDKFTVLRCSFLGFGPRYFDGLQKDGSYYLNCPGAPDLRGISGGAAVDDNGRVWGVNVTGLPMLSIVIVSPLSKGPGGEPVTGIQKTFISDQCYEALSREAHRCEVMPNMYESDVP